MAQGPPIEYTDAISGNSYNFNFPLATDANVIVATPELNALRITSDTANTATVYLYLGAGPASATSWHVLLTPGGTWDGTVGGVAYRGQVRMFSAAAARLAVVSV